MRILWIKTELLHPVDKGGRIRTYQMLRSLRRTHDVTYLCLDDGTAAPDAVDRASEYADQVVTVPFSPPPKGSLGFGVALARNLASSLPYAVSRYRSAAMQEQVEGLVGAADLVVCDFLAPSINVPAPLPVRNVLFQHNVEAVIWQRHTEVPQGPVRRAFMRRQWLRMRRYEAAVCRRFDHVVAVSDQDARVFREEYRAASVSSVGTGVDLQYFSPRPATARDNDEVVFVGSMDWMPNEDGVLWFLENVLPALRARRPGARLTVVGRSPTARLLQAAAGAGGVEVTGSVPDVRPYLARAALSVVPLRIGGGTRLKIYESMAMGTAVVSTSIGAEGLPLEPGVHIGIADEPAAMAGALAGLMDDPARAGRMAGAALDFVRLRCGWDAVTEQFLANCME